MYLAASSITSDWKKNVKSHMTIFNQSEGII